MYEPSSGGTVTKAGVYILTSGERGLSINGVNTVAQIYLAGNAANGIVLVGDYPGAAIHIPQNQKLALSNNASLDIQYNSTNNRIEFLNQNTVRGYVDMGAGSDIKMN